MNTPAYFCIGSIGTAIVSTPEIVTSHLNIYPNPANDFVVIEAKNISEITILDLSGKVIYQTNTNSPKTRIDISSFNTGVYLLSVKDNDALYSQKLVVE